jgi:two-component system CheB/CheR fusion protein
MTRIQEPAADVLAIGFLVVQADGTVAMANPPARAFLGLGSGDGERPFSDLEVSDLPADLRSAVRTVQADRQPLTVEQVELRPATGVEGCFDVHLAPILDHDAVLGVAVSLIDVTLSRRLQEELESSTRALESTNEELQSTIQELETMNADLQATIEELQAINDELGRRTSELDDLNDFLESILTSQRGGMAVIDGGLRVTVWNHRSEELWGLRPEEAIGRHFLNLDIGLPVEDLRSPIRTVLAGKSDQVQVDLRASHRRGRDFICRVSLAPLLSKQRDVRGVILFMEELNRG